MTSTTSAENTASETQDESPSGGSTRGRPRGDARTEAILEATHTVLHRDGWEAFKMDSVAKQAGCGLATIYRRWDTKEELAAASMRYRFLPIADETGDPEVDLRALIEMLAQEVINMGGHCLGLMAATQSHPEMQAAMSEGMMNQARPTFGGYLRALLGDDSPHVELLTDAIAGSLMVRVALLGDHRTAAEFADEAMALITALR